jgi:hypothetical protein
MLKSLCDCFYGLNTFDWKSILCWKICQSKWSYTFQSNFNRFSIYRNLFLACDCRTREVWAQWLRRVNLYKDWDDSQSSLSTDISLAIELHIELIVYLSIWIQSIRLTSYLRTSRSPNPIELFLPWKLADYCICMCMRGRYIVSPVYQPSCFFNYPQLPTHSVCNIAFQPMKERKAACCDRSLIKNTACNGSIKDKAF